jgi:hypothetical protein
VRKSAIRAQKCCRPKGLLVSSRSNCFCIISNHTQDGHRPSAGSDNCTKISRHGTSTAAYVDVTTLDVFKDDMAHALPETSIQAPPHFSSVDWTNISGFNQPCYGISREILRESILHRNNRFRVNARAYLKFAIIGRADTRRPIHCLCAGPGIIASQSGKALVQVGMRHRLGFASSAFRLHIVLPRRAWVLWVSWRPTLRIG